MLLRCNDDEESDEGKWSKLTFRGSCSVFFICRKLEEIEKVDDDTNPQVVNAMKTILQGLLDSQIEKVSSK